MKKFFALVLALALICSFGVTAFAAGSPTGSSPTEEYIEEAVEVEEEEENAFAVCDGETDEETANIPTEDIIMVDVADADTLEEADKEAFLAAYEAAKEIEGKVVVDFFWLDLPDEYTIDADHYLKFTFKCEGKNVEVQVNGNNMEVVPQDAPNRYVAKLTETGSVAILCDAE